jgi:hypothetical protein
MKLTKSNYYSLTNKYISNSKLGDFIKDKNYFYQKHIAGTIPHEVTDPMIIGSAVDTWLTQGEKKFREDYILVSRRSDKDGDYEHQLNPTMYAKIEKMCRRVESQDAYKQLKGSKRQVILQKDIPLGQFEGICGMVDFLKIKDDVAYIIDLKTSETIDTKKYHYHALSYNYYRQMAFYTLLVKHTYPEVQEVVCRHLVVEKDPNEIYTCRTFILSNERIEEEIDFINLKLNEIQLETKWLPNNCSWDQAETIGALTEEF